MTNDYIEKLNECIVLQGQSKAHKILIIPGKLLIARILMQVARLLNKTIQVKAPVFWGDEMVLVFPEGISGQLFQYGYLNHEEGLTAFMLRYLKPGMVFFDIGAHFGYYTLLGAELVGYNGQVHSFEPTPNTFQILLRNTTDKTNIKINNIAIWSNDAELLLKDFGLQLSGYNSLCAARLEESESKNIRPQQHRVQATSLDSYIEHNNVLPDFIKIDAESAEYNILQGMENILARHRPLVCFEVGDMDLDGVVSSKVLLQYMLDKNYQPYEFQGTDIIKHQLRDKYTNTNVLFIPIEKSI